MNVSSEDLRAAVARGIVTEVQSAQLIAIAASRQCAKDNVPAVEEPFVLLKGFNEFFVVVGLAIRFPRGRQLHSGCMWLRHRPL